MDKDEKLIAVKNNLTENLDWLLLWEDTRPVTTLLILRDIQKDLYALSSIIDDKINEGEKQCLIKSIKS